MTQYTLTVALVILAVASAFQPASLASRPSAFVARSPISAARTVASSPSTLRFMFSSGDDPKGNDEVEDIVTPLSVVGDQPEGKNLVKNVPTGEVKNVEWNDPTAGANNQFSATWGWFFILAPAILFLNDIFHFVPKGTWGIF